MQNPTPGHSNAPVEREQWRHTGQAAQYRMGTYLRTVAGVHLLEGAGESWYLLQICTGFGEDAYWVGNVITGALYVLQGDIFLRISVGGVHEESARIEKAQALARDVMRAFDRTRRTQYEQETEPASSMNLAEPL